MATSNDLLQKLASDISASVEVLRKHIAENGLPQPSFDSNGPPEFPIIAEDAEATKARATLIDATKMLHDLALGPAETIRWIGMWVSILTEIPRLTSLC
jgi:hypothetical protein